MNVWLAVLTAFLASGVEAVEALTIVLAVGVTSGWRVSLAGAAAAVLALAAIVAAFGPGLAHFASIGIVRLIVGALLFYVGAGWLRKAIARYAGRKALRDEHAAYAQRVAALEARERDSQRVGFATSFNGVLLEGFEVAVIVVTVGGSFGAGGLSYAALGALAAIILVSAAGIAVHAPLARVPENLLKFIVGIMLTTFGTFWGGEGLGVRWWHGDAAIGLLAAFYLAASLTAIAAMRAVQRPRPA